MNRGWKHIISILSIVLMLVVAEKESFAQKVDAFARVSVLPREGVVRQPYKVNISVYSSTWFAKPLQFANLHIENAFIIPFTRTVSSINYINNKKYATLTFYYLVFPYSTGTLTIPRLEISASIPPEGGYKGEPVSITTNAQNIKVKEVPSTKDEKVWMVAKNITLKESWSKPLTNLKVGDVLERQITITANGTLPSLIQPFKIAKSDSVSIYPKQEELQDKRTAEDVNGVRIERYAYLFEKEGKIIIPEEEILWWNPQNNRSYKRTIAAKELTIAANPDLAMMESLKDSLLAMSAPLDVEAEEKEVPWLRIVVMLFVVLVFLFFGTKTLRNIIRRSKSRRLAYLQSEAWYFKQLIRALNSSNKKEFIRQLYVWFDQIRTDSGSASFHDFLNTKEKLFFDSIFLNDSNLTASEKEKLNLILKLVRKTISNPLNSKGGKLELNPV